MRCVENKMEIISPIYSLLCVTGSLGGYLNESKHTEDG